MCSSFGTSHVGVETPTPGGAHCVRIYVCVCVARWYTGHGGGDSGTVSKCSSFQQYREFTNQIGESGRSAPTSAASEAHKQLSEQGGDIGLLSRSQYLLRHHNTSHQHTGDNVGKLLIVENEKYEESNALC